VVTAAGGIKLVGEKPGSWHFTVASGTEQGKKYDVHVKFADIKNQISQAVQDLRNWNKDRTKPDLRKVSAQVVDNADLKISCSCPSFLYHGFAYIATKRGTKYGRKETRPPKKRNPKEYGIGCKHAHLMFEVIPFYKSTMSGHIKRFFMPTVNSAEKEMKKQLQGVKKATDFLRGKEGSYPSESVNEAQFGSVEWQDEQIAKIKAKLEKGEPLNGADKAFIETQLEHNKRAEIEELERMWKASESVSEQGTTTVEPMAPPAPARPATPAPARPAQPAPSKPRSPIAPKPGVTPNPKAQQQRDIDLFVQARKGLTEAEEIFKPATPDELTNRKKLKRDPAAVGAEKTEEVVVAPTGEIIKMSTADFNSLEAADIIYWDAGEESENIPGQWQIEEEDKETVESFLKANPVTEAEEVFIPATPDELQKRKQDQDEFSWEELQDLWGGTLNYKGTKYRLGRMSYGDYFLQPADWKGGETDGEAPGTLWLKGNKVYGYKILSSPVTEADVIHPQKKEWMRTGDPELNALLPTLGDEEKSYLETITSKNYADLVAKIQQYTGVELTQENLPTLVSLLRSTLQNVMSLERAHKQYLEEMALMLVFDVPEFKMVEDAYLSDQLRFDIKLEPPTMEDLFPAGMAEPEEGGLSDAEELNQDLADSFEGIDPERLKRRLANLITTGGSALKMHLFALMDERLSAIDSDLPKKYGILATLAMLGYWVTPEGVEKGAAASAAGSSQVVPKDDIYTIKARAVTFPYLVHEIVKGIYEWLSLRPEQQEIMGKETIDQETRDFLAGPEIFKTISAYLPQDRQELLPLVQKLMADLSPSDIKDVLSKSSEGRFTMNKLIAQAQKMWDEYQAQKPRESKNEAMDDRTRQEINRLASEMMALSDQGKNPRRQSILKARIEKLRGAKK